MRRCGVALAASLWLIAGLIFLGMPVSAEEPAPARLEELERTLEQESGRAQSLESEAQALATDVARLQQELIAAASTAQDSEEEMSQLEATLAVLEEEAAAAEAELAARHGQLGAILGALQRLALQPPEAMLLGPATPLDTVRGATLLKVALPAVEGRARALKAELESLRQLRAEIDGRRLQLAGATTRLDAERQRLDALVEEKRSLQQQTESERLELENRVAALGQQAADLKELMARISLAPPPVPGTKPAVPGTPESAIPESTTPESTTPESAAPPVAEPAALLHLDRPPEIRPFPATQASLTTPARGAVVVRYGEAGEASQSSKGISIATRPEAQVVAPFDGQVMFRGPFRGYGEILILEHAGGYHTLLAGLGRTDAIVGQWLLAGEPVGIMGPAAGGNPELYLELRRDGQPINPLPWLDIRDSKTE
jgi:septal ring factor EnvC (AmiA/AmiB activator)